MDKRGCSGSMISTYNEFIDANMCRDLIDRATTISKDLPIYREDIFKNMDEYLSAQKESGHFIDESRGNRTQIFFDRKDPLIFPIRKKIAELTNLPIEHQTRPLLTIYNAGDEYKNHFDFIPSPGQGGQRLKSVVLYLNDDYEGGTTYFEQHRLFINPEKGKLLIFDNVKQKFWKFIGEERFYRNGKDETVKHRVIPVRKGTKFVIIMWIRESIPAI